MRDQLRQLRVTPMLIAIFVLMDLLTVVVVFLILPNLPTETRANLLATVSAIVAVNGVMLGMVKSLGGALSPTSSETLLPDQPATPRTPSSTASHLAHGDPASGTSHRHTSSSTPSRTAPAPRQAPAQRTAQPTPSRLTMPSSGMASARSSERAASPSPSRPTPQQGNPSRYVAASAQPGGSTRPTTFAVATSPRYRTPRVLSQRFIGVLFVIGAIFSAIWALALVLFQTTYTSSCAYSATSCPQSGLTHILAYAVLFGLVPAIMFSLLAWVLGLAKAAMLSRWGWFSAIFLLGAFALLLYLFIGPEHPPASALRARNA